MKKICAFLFLFTAFHGFAQRQSQLSAQAWVDSVFNSLTDEQRITQLMVVRLSARDPKTMKVSFYDQQVARQVQQYNVGGVCLFQGGPIKQVNIMNYLQSIAQTPIMMCIDGEFGLGMRIDSVRRFPYQLTAGAVQDGQLIRDMGRAIGDQCRRMGVLVNYAPVVDVNNNPNNPVINFRSFGEDKYKVGLYGVQMMLGMQEAGILACAKHFPGHGDTEADSHLALPVINKTRAQLDSLELYPFRQIFNAGVGSVMIAHLYIPSIDNTRNVATSLSFNNVTHLLREELNYQGLTFTDALEMQGVVKYFPNGEASARSLIAGNDMLCLPGDIPASIARIKEAIKKGSLKWEQVYAKVKKVLHAKYQLGLHKYAPTATANLVEELNVVTPAINRKIYENAFTLLSLQEKNLLPLQKQAGKKIAYIAIGTGSENALARRMKADYNADVFYFDYKQNAGRIPSLVYLLKKRYDAVVIGLHNYAVYPARNFGISNAAVNLMQQLQNETRSITLVFGNPYAIKNCCSAANLAACYEDTEEMQQVAADFLAGKIVAKGKLPVTVCDNYPFGSGIMMAANKMPVVSPEAVGMSSRQLEAIDSVANDAIGKGAAPGCVVLVARNGQIAYNKAFGYYNYDKQEAVSTESIYDLASVTKICATTISVMKLYEQGKLDLKKKLGDYLPWVRGSNKEGLLIEDILLHQAGLKSWIPFYKETIDSSGKPLPGFYSSNPTPDYPLRVAENMYMSAAWRDTMYKRILESPLEPRGKYVYSDNDFIFLGKIVEALSGMPLEEYVQATFYRPLGLATTGYRPGNRFPLGRIAPSEKEKYFRLQLIRGDVHDPGAAMFGGVAGHAGLFSNATDLALLVQMLLNGGSMNGVQYLKPETIALFTAYGSAISRRGLGFDKPEKDNATRKEPYPCRSASALTFGHTGFTGTCVWVDPQYKLVYIFLSNRVTPNGGDNQKLAKMNVRTNIQETIYKAMGVYQSGLHAVGYDHAFLHQTTY
jgi:beta-N-acetylhexosaminidase